MERNSDQGEREGRTIVAVQMNDNPKSMEMTLEAGDHLWINTPEGRVGLYINKHYSAITSWAENVHFCGFYNKKTTKKTTKTSTKNVTHVSLDVVNE